MKSYKGNYHREDYHRRFLEKKFPKQTKEVKERTIYYILIKLIYIMALVKEYFELTKSYQEEYGNNTILLMQVGSFFEVYGIRNELTETVSGSRIEDFSKITGVPSIL